MQNKIEGTELIDLDTFCDMLYLNKERIRKMLECGRGFYSIAPFVKDNYGIYFTMDQIETFIKRGEYAELLEEFKAEVMKKYG